MDNVGSICIFKVYCLILLLSSSIFVQKIEEHKSNKERLVRMADSGGLLSSFHCLCDDMESEWTIKCKQGDHCAVVLYKQQTEHRWCLPGGLLVDTGEVQVNSPVVLY